MTETKSNRATKLMQFLVCVTFILFGLRLVGSVIFNPYGTEGVIEATIGIFLILAGLILPLIRSPKLGKHSEMIPNEDQ